MAAWMGEGGVLFLLPGWMLRGTCAPARGLLRKVKRMESPMNRMFC